MCIWNCPWHIQVDKECVHFKTKWNNGLLEAWEEERITQEMPDEGSPGYRRHRHGAGSRHGSRDRLFLGTIGFLGTSSSLTLLVPKDLSLSLCWEKKNRFSASWTRQETKLGILMLHLMLPGSMEGKAAAETLQHTRAGACSHPKRASNLIQHTQAN